jgi:hypothetical protein
MTEGLVRGEGSHAAPLRRRLPFCYLLNNSNNEDYAHGQFCSTINAPGTSIYLELPR